MAVLAWEKKELNCVLCEEHLKQLQSFFEHSQNVQNIVFHWKREDCFFGLIVIIDHEIVWMIGATCRRQYDV
jgi:hypothetical protein